MSQGESERKNESLFIQLVLMFQAAAMQQMGKVQNPITKTVERNLEQARFSIDMLEMIQSRTKGNLSENEEKFLEHTLFELRMNYLDETKSDQQKKDPKASGDSSQGEEEQKSKDTEAGQKKESTEEEPASDRPESG
jgi:hypothetical protein